MIALRPHESPNPFYTTLHEAFAVLQDELVPPFPLKIPNPSEHETLTLALTYALLTQPRPQIHLAHLHATVLDGYRLFTTTLTRTATDLYPSLLPRPRSQLLSLLPTLVDVAAVGADEVFVALLRRIESGDLSPNSLWLAGELVSVLLNRWDWTVDTPGMLANAVFVFLRLLADHWRLSSGGFGELEALKRREVDFCVKALTEEFALLSPIGRDLVRLLQDVVLVPEIGNVWRGLLRSNSPSDDDDDIGRLCRTRTPSRYMLLRVSVEMETRLRFLLTSVKWGSQTRYLKWFAKKFLARPEQETLVVDLVRFVCCAQHHHPSSNETTSGNVFSRWALVGWLLKCCCSKKSCYLQGNAKLALFYDWLFFNEEVDNVMNIEPAILLMVNSLPKYADMTNNLMEFLFLLMDNYDPGRKDMISLGVARSFRSLVRKGVVSSLSPLNSDVMVAPMLRQRMTSFLSTTMEYGVGHS